MIGPRWLQAVIFLIALIAAITATPKLLVMEDSPLTKNTGAPADTGPLGHSMLAKLLEQEGYKVLLYMPKLSEIPSNISTLVVWLPGPRQCQGIAEELYEAFKAFRERGGRVNIILATDNPRCLDSIAGLAPISPPKLKEDVIIYAGLKALLAEYPGGTFIAYSAKPLEASRDWIVFSRTLLPPGRVIGLAYLSNSLSLVLFSDSDLFSNLLLSINETRIRELALYIAKGLSDEPSRTLMVIPTAAYISSIEEAVADKPTALFHPGILAALFAKYYSGLEDSFVTFLEKVPWLFVFLVLSLGGLAYMLLARSVESVLAEYTPPGPPRPILLYGFTPIYEMLRRGELSSRDAKRALQNLYEALDTILARRTGYGVKGILREKEVLSQLAARLGLEASDLEERLSRLHRLYLKAKGERKLPIVLRWRKTLLRQIDSAETILEGIGVSLKELRGLEFELTR